MASRKGTRQLNHAITYVPAALFVLLCITLILLNGCARNTKPISKTGFYFDTVIQITLYDTKDTAYLDGCFDLAKTYENMLSATIEGSDIWNINHSNGQPVVVSKETSGLIQTALSYAMLYDGKIDPTIFPVSRLWHFGSDEEPCVPAKDDIVEALTHVDYHTIQTDGNTVTLKDPKAALDLGFIAKGYIADQIKKYLLENGVKSACINLGGNVLTVGSKPDGSDFHIGIQEPFAKEGQAVTVVNTSDMSLVSSGIYERYFYEDGILYHHILDTETGYPLNNDLAGVTILSASSTEGDALSTTCYLLGLTEGLSLIESLDNVEALFITRDGKLYTTSGFPDIG